jgi:GPH family glycoside/pentoside/hexuronide:cation symporter
MVLTTTIVTWLLFYATGGTASSGQAGGHHQFGLAMALGRIVDAITDPLVGRWSDRTRTRFGRRVPFVLAGALPLGFSFAALWLPYTGAPTQALAIRMGIALSVFFTMYTVVVCPYLAMLPEIARDSGARLRLSSLQATGSIIGGGVITVFGVRLFEAVGFPLGGAMIGAFAAGIFLVVGAAFATQPGYQPAKREHGGPVGLTGPVRSAWRLVAKQPTFRFYLLGMAAVWIGLNMMVISMPYIVTCVLRRPTTEVARLGAGNLAGTLLALPFVGRAARRYGKGPVLQASALLLGCLFPLLALGPAGAWASIWLAGPMLACIYTLPHPVLADITDTWRQRTKDGQEALHFGAQGLVLKGALALAAWMAGALFERFGASPQAWDGLRAAAVVSGLFCAFGGLALGQIRRDGGPGR